MLRAGVEPGYLNRITFMQMVICLSLNRKHAHSNKFYTNTNPHHSPLYTRLDSSPILSLNNCGFGQGHFNYLKLSFFIYRTGEIMSANS